MEIAADGVIRESNDSAKVKSKIRDRTSARLFLGIRCFCGRGRDRRRKQRRRREKERSGMREGFREAREKGKERKGKERQEREES